MDAAIRTTIDSGGRVVIPKRIRDRLGLRAGAPLVVAEHDGTIEIRPAPLDVDLVRHGSVTVFQPRTQLAPIDDDDVREAVEHLRSEQGR